MNRISWLDLLVSMGVIIDYELISEHKEADYTEHTIRVRYRPVKEEEK